jgi:2-polyprenyl-6-methoxyphenol hydroxylase-like FAD-dependent oxidoreductase
MLTESCPYLPTVVAILAAVLLVSLGVGYRASRRVRPVGSGKNTSAVPGRESQEVYSRTFGPATGSQGWRQSQFLEEFEAQIAATHLDQDSRTLLTRADGKYTNSAIQDRWELWCRAIALTHARLNGPE